MLLVLLIAFSGQKGFFVRRDAVSARNVLAVFGRRVVWMIQDNEAQKLLTVLSCGTTPPPGVITACQGFFLVSCCCILEFNPNVRRKVSVGHGTAIACNAGLGQRAWRSTFCSTKEPFFSPRLFMFGREPTGSAVNIGASRSRAIGSAGSCSNVKTTE